MRNRMSWLVGLAAAVVVCGALAGGAQAQYRRMPGRTVIVPNSAVVRPSQVVISPGGGGSTSNIAQQLAYNQAWQQAYGLTPYYGNYGTLYSPAVTSFYNPYARSYRRSAPIYNIYYVNPYPAYLGGLYP